MAAKEIVVVGAGIVGAATAYHLSLLAKELNQPTNITVLERSPEGVQAGGSVGFSRITRINTRDVPTVCAEMTKESNRLGLELGCVTPTHAVTFGNFTGKIMPAIVSAEFHGVPHERLSASDLAGKYSFLHTAGCVGVDEFPMSADGFGAGIVNPNKLVSACLEKAKGNGVVARYDCSVTDIKEEKDGVTLQVSTGETIHADKLVLSTGAWTPELLGKDAQIGGPYISTVEPLFYFKCDGFDPLSLPTFMVKLQGGERLMRTHPEFTDAHPEMQSEKKVLQVYVMPEETSLGPSIKVGLGVPTSKDLTTSLDDKLKGATATDKEHKLAADILLNFMPGLAPHLPSANKGQADLVHFGPYSTTPDFIPVISPLSANGHIIGATGDAGVCAKFALEIGRHNACYALGCPERIPEAAREVFSKDRPMSAATTPEKAVAALASQKRKGDSPPLPS